MILQHIQSLDIRSMLLPPGNNSKSRGSSPSKDTTVTIKIKMEDDSNDDENDCVPLDLSVHGGRLSPGLRDSGTESDDSGGRCSPEGRDCKAYKKSLMKRYCKSTVHLLRAYLCYLLCSPSDAAVNNALYEFYVVIQSHFIDKYLNN